MLGLIVEMHISVQTMIEYLHQNHPELRSNLIVGRFILIESKKHHAALFDQQSSTRLPWLWTLSLLSYRRASANGSLSYPVGPFDGSSALGCIDNFLNGTVVFDALDANPHVLELLLAAVHQIPPCMYVADSSSEAQALAYVHDSSALWSSMPEAVEWVYRCYSTREALRHITSHPPQFDASFESFEKLVSVDQLHDSHQCSWQEHYGLIRRESCHKAFSQLDLDGDGSISAVEMKLWFQKVQIYTCHTNG